MLLIADQICTANLVQERRLSCGKFELIYWQSVEWILKASLDISIKSCKQRPIFSRCSPSWTRRISIAPFFVSCKRLRKSITFWYGTSESRMPCRKIVAQRSDYTVTESAFVGNKYSVDGRCRRGQNAYDPVRFHWAIHAPTLAPTRMTCVVAVCLQSTDCKLLYQVPTDTLDDVKSWLNVTRWWWCWSQQFWRNIDFLDGTDDR